MRVLIVPDKFKGTLTARQAAEAMAVGWREGRPEDELHLLPMSDGGDGFGEIIGELLDAVPIRTDAVNAAHEPVEVLWWWSPEKNTAIVESARAIGLAMLPKGKHHPFELDTLGLGILLQRIAAEHPGTKLIVGIGGSATNDGGFGMARGLGFRFLAADGADIEQWTQLDKLDRIVPARPLALASLTIATDVANPLLGPEGASRIYGPQKGLRPSDYDAAERCLANLSQKVKRDLGVDAERAPGAGAAGGLGYGLRVFLNGAFEPGFDIFSRLSGLRSQIENVDFVLTGEGSIDAQTQMGKGTGAVAQLARELGKPCLGLAGLVSARSGVFAQVHAIVPDLAHAEEAMARPGDWVRELSRRTAEGFHPD